MNPILSDLLGILIISVFVAAVALALSFYLLSRAWKRNALFWKDLCQQREWECRQWRETNGHQRRQIVDLAKQVRDFDPNGGGK